MCLLLKKVLYAIKKINKIYRVQTIRKVEMWREPSCRHRMLLAK